MVNKWLQLAVGTLLAGAAQFGFSVASGITDPLLMAGGVIGQMGIVGGAMLKQLPQREWSHQERTKKLSKE
jgi:hypothetical protein